MNDHHCVCEWFVSADVSGRCCGVSSINTAGLADQGVPSPVRTLFLCILDPTQDSAHMNLKELGSSIK